MAIRCQIDVPVHNIPDIDAESSPGGVPVSQSLRNLVNASHCVGKAQYGTLSHVPYTYMGVAPLGPIPQSIPGRGTAVGISGAARLVSLVLSAISSTEVGVGKACVKKEKIQSNRPCNIMIPELSHEAKATCMY